MTKLNSFFGFFRKFNKLHLLGYSMVAFFFFGLVAYGYNSIFVQAAGNVTCYWVGDTSPAAWSDVTHWSSSSGGAGSTCDGGIIPSSTDIATFTSLNTNSANVDVNISVKGIAMNTGYTGTISQDAGKTVGVGTSGFVQAAGTYSATASMTITSGPLTKTGGTFSEGIGTVSFSGNSATITANGQTFNNFTVNLTAGQVLTIPTATAITVNGTLSLTAGMVNTSSSGTGSVNVKGDVTVASGFVGYSDVSLGWWNTPLFSFNGTGAQNVTLNGGSLPAVTFNNSNLNVTPLANTTFFNLSLTAGTYNCSTFTTTIAYNLIVTTGTFHADSGTVTFDSALNDRTTINANGQVFNNLTVNKYAGKYLTVNAGTSITVNGALTLTSGIVGYNGGTINAKGDLSVSAVMTAPTSSVDPIVLNGTGAQNVTFAGGYVPALTFNNANINTTLTVNVQFQSLTLTAGTLNLSSYTVGLYALLTVNGGTLNTDTSTVTSINPYAYYTTINANGQVFNNLTVNSQTSYYITVTTGTSITVNGTLTLTNGFVNTGTINAKGTVTQATTFSGGTTVLILNASGAQAYTISGGTAPEVLFNNPNLNVTPLANCSFYSLTLTAGTYNGSSVTTTIGYITLTVNGGTFNANTGTVKMNYGPDTLIVSSGTFNANTGTILIAASTTITANGQVFNNFTITGGTSTVNTGTSITVNGTLTLTSGYINSGTINAKGTVTQATTFNGGSTVLALNASGAQTYTINGGTGPEVLFNNPNLNVTPLANCSFYSLTLTAGTYNGSSVTTRIGYTTLTVNGGTFNANTGTVSVDYTNTSIIVSSGTFNASSGTILILQSTTITADGQAFNNFTVNSTGTATIATGTSITVNGTLTLTNGAIGTGTVNIGGNLAVASTWDIGNAVYNFAGASLQTISGTGVGASFTTGQVTVNNNAIVATSANTTITKLTIAAGGSFSAEDFTFTSTTFNNNGTFKLSGDKAVTTPTHGAGSIVEYIATAGSRNIQSWSYKGLKINGSGGTFTLPGTITAAEGVTIANGIFDVGVNTLNVGGSWTKSGGTFTANTSTVNLNTATTATISGSSTFNNLTLDGTAAGAKQINFTAGSTQTINTTFTLTGAIAKVLTLRSTVPGAPWYFVIPGNMTSGTYINVQDSQNVTNANRITAGANVTDAGNNDPGWLLSPATPTIGAPVALSATSIRWNFTDNATIEDGFKVYDAGNNLVATCATPNLTYCDETGLSVNTTYAGRYVVAYNGSGNSTHSGTAASIYTLAAVPGTPTVNNTALATSLTIIVDANSNSVATEFAISCDADGTFLNYTANVCEAIADDANHWRTFANWGSASGFTDTGLLRNTNHIYKVMARNGDNVNTGLSTSAEKYTRAVAPGSPTVTTLSATALTVVIAVNGNPAPTEFSIQNETTGQYIQTDGTLGAAEAWQNYVAWGGAAGIGNTGLSPNVQYSFAVKARNGDNTETDFSGSELDYTLATTPLAPTVSPDTSSALVVVVNSNGNSAATEFAVSCDADATFLNFTTNACEAIADDANHWRTFADWGGATGFSDTGLSVNTSHSYKVIARNGENTNTALSSGDIKYTLANAPDVPTITVVSATGLNIQIAVNGNPATTTFAVRNETIGQYLQVDGTLGVGSVWRTFADWGGATGIENTGLIAGTTYTYSVSAQNGDSLATASSGGTSGTTQSTPSPTPIPTPEPTPSPEPTPTPVTETTNETPVTIPLSSSNQIVLKAGDVTETQIILSWEVTNKENVVGYKIYDAATDQLIGETTERRFVVSSLKPNTDYTFRVLAVEQSGSYASNVVTAKTAVAPVVEKVTQTKASILVKLLSFAKIHLYWFIFWILVVVLLVLFLFFLIGKRKKDEEEKRSHNGNQIT